MTLDTNVLTPEERIIDLFHEVQGEWVSANKLEEKTRLSSAELESELKKLIQVGYRIEYQADLGYKLNSIPDRLIPDEIRWGLRCQIVGRDILTYERVTSTMDIARKMVEGGAREGLVIFSEEQTGGRGRSGHAWVCPKFKGLLLTVVVKPRIDAEHIFLITGMAAVAVAESIQDMLSLKAEIKWPNDVLINGKKVAGAVVEVIKSHKSYLRQIRRGEQRYIFSLGIGINVNQEPHELPKLTKIPATSLSIEKKSSINRIDFTRNLLESIDKWYIALKETHYEQILKRWRELCITIGQKLTVVEGDKLYHGKVIDISPGGGIILHFDDGQKKTFMGEHISLKT
ncbi:MAG TPA: biotin--[acetyl-CoA-carboxylase] ligase [Candidatus Brocadiales bacterium]|nr:biotin--[acetyl-CoA-carboxylase] ligase [Candidatus Brocadiales bacterium]